VIATPNGEAYAHTAIATGLQTIINGDNIVRYDYATFVEYTSAAIIAFILILSAAYAPYWLGGHTVGPDLFRVSIRQLFCVYSTPTTVGRQLVVCGNHHHQFPCRVQSFRERVFSKQQIKKQFGTYLSPDMVERLQRNPGLLRLGGETRELSIYVHRYS
jgi:hypothetical protein